MTDDTGLRRVAVLGASDGVQATAGLVLAEASRGRVAVLLAAWGLLVAEGFGMAVSERLSGRSVGWRGPVIMGLATSAPVIAVAFPWLFVSGNVAIAASVVAAVVIGGIIGLLRGRSIRKIVGTLAALAMVCVLAAGASYV